MYLLEMIDNGLISMPGVDNEMSRPGRCWYLAPRIMKLGETSVMLVLWSRAIGNRGNASAVRVQDVAREGQLVRYRGCLAVLTKTSYRTLSIMLV